METKENRDQQPATPQVMRNIFAVIMIIVYVGIGVLLLWNPDWCKIITDPSWNLLRWIGGPILILYGLFRAWRQIKGVDSPV